MRIGLYRALGARYTRPLCRPLCPLRPEWMLRRRYRDRISLVEFINCVMASGARLPVQIEKNPPYASHSALSRFTYVLLSPLALSLLRLSFCFLLHSRLLSVLFVPRSLSYWWIDITRKMILDSKIFDNHPLVRRSDAYILVTFVRLST